MGGGDIFIKVLFILALTSQFLYLPLCFAQGPCDEDLKRFCPEYVVGRTSVSLCLDTNISALSPSCREQRELLKPLMQKIAVACRHDVDKYCGATDIKPGKLRACVNQFKSNFTTRCQSEIKAHEEKRREAKKPSAPTTITIELDGSLAAKKESEKNENEQTVESKNQTTKKKNVTVENQSP